MQRLRGESSSEGSDQIRWLEARLGWAGFDRILGTAGVDAGVVSWVRRRGLVSEIDGGAAEREARVEQRERRERRRLNRGRGERERSRGERERDFFIYCTDHFALTKMA